MKSEANQYEVEAIVSIDGRGQIVLPKEVRQALSLEAGAKLAVVVKRSGGVPCCVNLVPARSLEAGVRAVIEPVSVAGSSL